LIIPQIREGVDGPPKKWVEHLAAFEADGHVEYSICHHKMKAADGTEQPVASRGDRCPESNTEHFITASHPNSAKPAFCKADLG
jgi:hypothetical protein